MVFWEPSTSAGQHLPPCLSRHRTGFTLIELLVVIAIIAILAAILFPVFAKAREKARQTTCMNNQRQIAIAIQMYAQDFDETMPASTVAWGALNLERKLLLCPSETVNAMNTYGFSSSLSGMALGDIKDPSGTVMTADYNSRSTTTPANILATGGDIAYRHSTMAVCAFVDGHATSTTAVPIAYIAPNPYVWLAADAITPTPADGTPVTSWLASGTATTKAVMPSGKTGPAFYTGIVNGKPVLRFNASNSTALSLQTSSGNSTSFQARFVAMVLSIPTSGPTWGRVLSGSSGGEGFIAYYAGNVYVRFGSDYSIAPVDGKFHLLSAGGMDFPSTGQVNPFANWDTTPSKISPAGVTLTIQDIGWDSAANGQHLSMDVAEIIGWNTSLSSADKAAALQYLKTKYNTP